MNAPPRNTQTRVSVIELDSVELAVPQTNLHAVESVLDFRCANDGRAAAYIKLHGEQWPVYCPNDSLEVVELKVERRICAMLIVGNGLFGLVCREVSNIEAEELRTFELPVCMRTPDTPLRGLGLVGARVVCLTSAQSLYTMFAAQHANRDACVISSQQSDLGDPLTRARSACMTAKAWLLTLEDGTPVAVGERELMHIVSDELERSFIPMAPEYAREVIEWQSRSIPLFNATAVLRRGNCVRDLAAGVPGSGGATIVAIAAYQVTKESRVELGALSLGGLPERIEVADDSGCALPPEQPGWRRLAHSCYQHSQLGAVPILDLCRMFAPGARSGQGLNQSTRH